MSDPTPATTTSITPLEGDLRFDHLPQGWENRVARLERELAAANAKIALMERVIAATALLKRVIAATAFPIDELPSRRMLHRIRTYASPLVEIGGITGLTRNALAKAGYTAVWQFCEESPEALLAKGLTEEQINEIRIALSGYYVVLGKQISPL